MKNKALYHLMMDRARHIRVHGNQNVIAFIDEIEESLLIDFDKGLYTISWRYRNQPHQIEMRHDSFKFYIRGDLGKPPTLRDVRRGNWEAALDLWRRIAETSGETWPAIIEESQTSMGLDISRPAAPIFLTLVKRYAPLAVAIFIIGFFMDGFGYALATAISGVCLAIFSAERTGLKSAPWPARINDWIIGLSAAIMPSFFHHNGLFGLAFILLMLTFLHYTEIHAAYSKPHWLTFTALTAIAAALTGSTGLGIGLLLFALLFALCAFVLPSRFDKKSLFIGAAFMIGGGALGMGYVPDMDMPWLVWLLVIAFATMSGIGWFIGELFTLMPWLIHGFLGFTALSSLIAGDAQMAGAVSMAAGFAAVEFIRMITAFRGTQAVPIIKPEGA